MDRPVTALILVVCLVALGLLLAFAGRPTVRLGWAIVTSELGIAAIVTGVMFAGGVIVLQASTTGSPASSSSPPAAATAPTGPATGLQIHVVRAGETLRALAAAYYQDESLWQRIYDANRGQIPDPDSLVVGARLVIP